MTVLMILDLYLDLISLIIGGMVFRRSWPFAYHCLFVLNVLRVIVSFASFIWAHYMHSSNHWIFNLFLPLQCLGFLLVFYSASADRAVARFNKWLLAAAPVAVVVFWIGARPLDNINLRALIAYDFLVLLSVCAMFVDMILRTDNLHFAGQPLFWLASGMFFYSVESIIGYCGWEFSKKMILFGMYKFIYFSGDYLQDVGIVGCFICLYLERRRVQARR